MSLHTTGCQCSPFVQVRRVPFGSCGLIWDQKVYITFNARSPNTFGFISYKSSVSKGTSWGWSARLREASPSRCSRHIHLGKDPGVCPGLIWRNYTSWLAWEHFGAPPRRSWKELPVRKRPGTEHPAESAARTRISRRKWTDEWVIAHVHLLTAHGFSVYRGRAGNWMNPLSTHSHRPIRGFYF